MRFHWYWPFARPEELDWARATARPGETVVVQVVDRGAAPEASSEPNLVVLRDLPDVDRAARGVQWLTSRGTTYRLRAAARHRLWDREQFDLIHLHYINRFTDAVVPLPKPLVISVHDVVPHVPRLGQAVERRLLRRLYSRPDAIVVHHSVLAERLCAEFKVRGERVHVVPHQVFPVGKEFRPPPGERPPMILFFGALRPNKGLPTLRDAMQLIPNLDCRVVIAGRGDPDLEGLARAMARDDSRITAEVGFVSLERKRELFAEATTVVLPYTAFASQSGVLHDAYGHGRPVVVTDVGALGSAVTEDQTGIVIPPGSAAGLAQAVTDLLDPVTWRTYSSAARQVARERSPVNVGRQLRDVYDVILG